MLTTPDALQLHRMMRTMVSEGCRWCVMEVSSHALDQQRVHALPFAGAAFTNLQHDHLDYHKTWTAYAHAKKQLFDDLAPTAFAVFNGDDAAGQLMVQDTTAQTIAYGQGDAADVRFDVLSDTLQGLRLRIDNQIHTTRLSGTFNAYNFTAAYALACAFGFSREAVCQALADSPPAPGRFETLRFDDGALVIVDYAHTPDALERALETARHYAPQAVLWCLFGCGGDRDRSKRAVMGAVAERLADRVVVTSDNTRSETYRAIGEDIAKGMQRPRRALWIEDRREAIGHVAQHATAGDVVLVAGKGHEAFQDTGDQMRPMSDRQLVLETFKPRVPVEN